MLYFNTQSKKLGWAKMINQNLVIEAPNGQSVYDLSNAPKDFAEPEACKNVPVDPNFPTFRSFAF